MATSQVFRNRIMLSEVHVHGTLDLCKGVTLGQVENGLRKWLEYMDVETISEASSLNRKNPASCLTAQSARWRFAGPAKSAIIS